MKTFVITGPESTGKSWLSERLATHYSTVWRKEYLREFYDAYNGIEEEQMQIVAQRQIRQEKDLLEENDGLIFFDTNIINLKVYYEFYFKKEPKWFLELYEPNLYDHYFLLDTSVPWQADPQRESPQVREQVFNALIAAYNQLDIKFDLITGDYEQRQKQLIELIDTKLEL